MNFNRFPLALAIVFIIFSSCKNSGSGDEANNNDDIINIEGDTRDPNTPDYEKSGSTDGNRTINNDNTDTKIDEIPDNDSPNNPDRSVSNAKTSGTYIKIGEESDTNCNCYCLDLNPATNPELCLVPGEMYITTRFQRNNDNSIDVYLLEPSSRNTQGKDMPWKDFDRNSPIATITPQATGEIEFDWLGFKINGDLAIDYAIFGKKTLEGQFKKK